VPDCLVLFRRLLRDPRVPQRRKAVLVLLVGTLDRADRLRRLRVD